MGERAEYKNSIRSRRLIRQALVELMAEKDAEKITVTDVVTRADINRGTFYAHYQDIREVLSQIEDDILDKITELFEDTGSRAFYDDPRPFIKELTAFFAENKKYYSILFSSKVSGQLTTRLKELCVARLRSDPRFIVMINDSPDFNLRATFAVGGIFNLYKEWFAGHIELDNDDAVSTLSELITFCRTKEPLPY